MTALQVVVSVSTAGIIAAVLGEVAWIHLGTDRHDVGRLSTAAAMVLGATPAAFVLARADAHLWPLLGAWSPSPLRAFWIDHPVLGAVAAFVAWDLAGYCYHRLGHGTRVGWAAHQVHHSGTSYDMTLAWRQSWFPLHALVAFPPVALLGVPLTTVVGCAAVSKLWQALVHTSLSVSLPRWVTAVVMTPATHRRHHTVEGGAANLGPVLTIWDRLAGTWDPSAVPSAASFGLQQAGPGHTSAGGPSGDRRGALRIETDGWRSLRASRKRPAVERTTDYGSLTSSM